MRLFAEELDDAAAAFGLRIAVETRFGRARGQFGGELGLEAGAAVAEQALGHRW
jgi:hypothetical protein